MLVKIIDIARAKSKSGITMWRAKCDDGKEMFVFKHRDPSRNTFALFEQAGYGDHLAQLSYGQGVRWNTYPIEVEVEQDGQWWKIVSVTPKPVNAAPDLHTEPELDELQSLTVGLIKDALQSANALYIAYCKVSPKDARKIGLVRDVISQLRQCAVVDIFYS